MLLWRKTLEELLQRDIKNWQGWRKDPAFSGTNFSIVMAGLVPAKQINDLNNRKMCSGRSCACPKNQ